MPYRFACTCLITGYSHLSRDIRKNVGCRFILLGDQQCSVFQNESDYKMEFVGLNSGLFACKLQPLNIRNYQYVLVACFLTLDCLHCHGVAEDLTPVFSHAKRALYL